jgi:hypothetical protein
MELVLGNQVNHGVCLICLKWKESVWPLRINENSSLPSAYRTLYTFKYNICPECRAKGDEHTCSVLHQYMDEYAGGHNEVLRPSGLRPCSQAG